MNNLFLCKPSGIILGAMTGLDENTASLKQQINAPWELTFTVHRYIYEQGQLVETTYYHSISTMMELLLDLGDKKIRFQINGEPIINNDGLKETKTVTAHSIECELQDKMLKLFQVNTGLDISQENLVQGDIDMNPVDPDDTITERFDYNFDPYEQRAIDYIRVNYNPLDFYETFAEEFESGKITSNIKKNEDGTTEEVDPITFNITVDSSTGRITSSNDSEMFPSYIGGLIQTYPRLSKHIRYYEDGDEYSETFGEVIAKVYYYLNVVQDSSSGEVYVAIMPKRFLVDDDYIATTLEEPDYSNLAEYFLEGLDDILRYYENFGNQLSLIQLALEKANAMDWSVGDIPENIAKLYRNFTVESQDIYSFFTQACAKSLKVIFDFDRFNKRVNIIDVANTDEEHDTGVVIGLQNLMNSVTIQSPSDDGIRTKFKPTGANGLNIIYVNFGEEYMINLDYFINATNEYGDYKYVSPELHDKYHAWKDYRENEEITVEKVPKYSYELATKTVTDEGKENITYSSRREAFADLSRKYNKAFVSYDEFNNLLPNDGTSIDYTKFTFDDLCVAWKAYNNALGVLLTYYYEDYNVANNDPEEPRTPDDEPSIPVRQTMYGLDYASYVDTIIPNVENALKIYVLTDAEGNFVEESKDENGEWVQVEGGNPYYNGDAKIVTENVSDAYMYDMSLYGASELEILRKSWVGAAAQLEKVGFILLEKDGNEIKKKVITIDDHEYYQYNTADENGWDLLATYIINDSKEVVDIGTPAAGQKTAQSLFASQESYTRLLNEYLDYVSLDVRENSKTKMESKGIIQLAVEELEKCLEQMDIIAEYQDDYDYLRKTISDTVSFENWSYMQEEGEGFTDQELAILYTLLREADYSNDNILITNLDDIVSTVDVQEELYQDASKKLFEKSRPQYKFSATIDNLLSIPEFKAWHSSIALLNYIYLVLGIYDNETVRVRIVSIQNNPLIPTSEITLEFSNMVYTYDGLSDLEALLSETLGGSSSSSSSSSSKSSGTYGENEANIQFSKQMLDALLRNNGYYTNVSTQVLSGGQAVKASIETGDVVIDGACIVDDVFSKNYNGTNGGIDNTDGSILKLADGHFNLGGGKIVWNGTSLIVDGDLHGTFDGEVTGITASSVKGGVLASNNNEDMIDMTNGSFSFADGDMIWAGSGNKISISATLDNCDGTFSGVLDNATGSLNGVTGTYNGSINSNGTFSGTLSNATGVFLGTVSGTLDSASGTIHNITMDDTIAYKGTSHDYQFIWEENSGIALCLGDYTEGSYLMFRSPNVIELSPFTKLYIGGAYLDENGITYNGTTKTWSDLMI